MRSLIHSLIVLIFLTPTLTAGVLEEAPISKETKACIMCHQKVTPGIVADWETSRHAKTTIQQALSQDELSKRISISQTPATVSADVAIGCYECHTLNAENHADNFKHYSKNVNVIVTPKDCATCHPVEVEEYSHSKKAYAIDNLIGNPLFKILVEASTGVMEYQNGLIQRVSKNAQNITCLKCHGTEVTVDGMIEVETDMGNIEVPNLRNWPNQGVGRKNPDGSLGSCAACHARHSFDIEIARKPYTCGQCHLEPDVPGFNIYKESKHGNIFSSKFMKFDFAAVPWTIGEDFTAPTCATCHNSLIVNSKGDVIANRTHDFGQRLWVRLFGLPYTTPQPIDGNTSKIINADGQPLPATFANVHANEYLIDPKIMDERKQLMGNICNACHSTNWVNNSFHELDRTIEEVDSVLLASTQLMAAIWEAGLADNTNPFDEAIERTWIEQWLFFGNSIKLASIMAGPDYAAFKNGWWDITKNAHAMKDFLNKK